MNKYQAAVGSMILGASTWASAAVPTEVTTALADGKTDAITVAAAVFLIIIGVFGVKAMRKGL